MERSDSVTWVSLTAWGLKSVTARLQLWGPARDVRSCTPCLLVRDTSEHLSALLHEWRTSKRPAELVPAFFQLLLIRKMRILFHNTTCPFQKDLKECSLTVTTCECYFSFRNQLNIIFALFSPLRFSTKSWLSQICQVCQKSMMFGVKCKYCRWAHSEELFQNFAFDSLNFAGNMYLLVWCTLSTGICLAWQPDIQTNQIYFPATGFVRDRGQIL